MPSRVRPGGAQVRKHFDTTFMQQQRSLRALYVLQFAIYHSCKTHRQLSKAAGTITNAEPGYSVPAAMQGSY